MTEPAAKHDDATSPGTAALQHTALHALHLELGARLVPFAGFEMPIQFEGVKAEHLHTRSLAGLFDVSHMGVVEFHGDAGEVAEILETILPTLLSTMKPGRQRYTFFTNDDGGVIDDLMIARRDSSVVPFVAVVNASRIDADMAHLAERLADHTTAGRIAVKLRRDLSILALQGPAAVEVAAQYHEPIGAMKFMDVAEVPIHEGMIVSRSGYTGEDGVEIIVDSEVAEHMARTLLSDDRAKSIGLGARDTLRLEAGLCLYGNDLSTTISPVEADLVWAIPKRRREGGGFPGAAVIQQQIADGPPRKRVGLAAVGRRPVRDGSMLTDPNSGAPVGVVTSGGFGPTVNSPVAMGLVSTTSESGLDLTAVGTLLNADVRGKPESVAVTALPFTPHNYKR